MDPGFYHSVHISSSGIEMAVCVNYILLMDFILNIYAL